jgi:hypothetical protein
VSKAVRPRFSSARGEALRRIRQPNCYASRDCDASALSDARSREAVEVGMVLFARSIKPLEGRPLAFAAEAAGLGPIYGISTCYTVVNKTKRAELG